MFDYKIEDIVTTLMDVGVKSGDSVFVHSNLGFFGHLENCKTSDFLCESFISAFFDILGEEGTLIVPTYSYSFCHNEVYDPESTPTTCGLLSSYFLKNYNNNRSLDPNFSVCGKGRLIDYYINCNTHESFGKDCFWERFIEKEGKVVCLNFDSGSTMVHYIEKINNVDYRYNKSFNGVIKIGNREYKDYAVHFVYDNTRDADAPFFNRLDEFCKKKQISHCKNLGNGTVLAFSSRDYVIRISDLLKLRPRFLVKEE